MRYPPRLIAICASLVAVAALIVGGIVSGHLQFVNPPDPSTAYRAAAYRAAVETATGTFHGTHFTVAAPPGWQPYPARLLSKGTELVLKQPPLQVPNPVIVVRVQDAPTDILLQVYLDEVHGDDVAKHMYDRVGNIHGLKVAGQDAEYYRWSQANGNMGLKIFAIRRAVAYEIEFATPPHEFSGSLGALSQFLSLWKWDDTG